MVAVVVQLGVQLGGDQRLTRVLVSDRQRGTPPRRAIAVSIARMHVVEMAEMAACDGAGARARRRVEVCAGPGFP